jgi:hypothetical protein
MGITLSFSDPLRPGIRPNLGDETGAAVYRVTSFLALRPDRVAGGSALLRFGVSAERDCFRLVAEPPSTDSPLARRVFHSFRSNESVPSSLHRHHLPLFDFAGGLFVDREWLLGCPFSDVPADRLRTSSKASSGVWTDARMAFSTRSSERAN